MLYQLYIVWLHLFPFLTLNRLIRTNPCEITVCNNSPTMVLSLILFLCSYWPLNIHLLVQQICRPNPTLPMVFTHAHNSSSPSIIMLTHHSNTRSRTGHLKPKQFTDDTICYDPNQLRRSWQKISVALLAASIFFDTAVWSVAFNISPSHTQIFPLQSTRYVNIYLNLLMHIGRQLKEFSYLSKEQLLWPKILMLHTHLTQHFYWCWLGRLFSWQKIHMRFHYFSWSKPYLVERKETTHRIKIRYRSRIKILSKRHCESYMDPINP